MSPSDPKDWVRWELARQRFLLSIENALRSLPIAWREPFVSMTLMVLTTIHSNLYVNRSEPQKMRALFDRLTKMDRQERDQQNAA